MEISVRGVNTYFMEHMTNSIWEDHNYLEIQQKLQQIEIQDYYKILEKLLTYLNGNIFYI